jgi:hypothetical protein
MRSKVYIATTIVSYLVASPTKDLIQSAHQESTRQWWAGRTRFDLFVSRVVGAEARRGDVRAAARRVAAFRGIPRLALRGEAVRLADDIVGKGALPAKARVDALHVGVAASRGIDYLLTGTSVILRTPPFVARSSRWFATLVSCRRYICTPEELMEPKP